MKNFLIIAAMLMLATGIASCTPDDPPATPNIPGQPVEPGGGSSDNNNPEEPGENNDTMKLTIKAGTAIFTATLADNATAKAFKAMLPMTVEMNELNRNEKYYDLPNALPTVASNPGTIHNGDLMLYGSRTLVLFYKTFTTSYNYTRIGSIDNPSGLENALGAGGTTITFE